MQTKNCICPNTVHNETAASGKGYRKRAARARERRARKVRFLYSLIAAALVLLILFVCLLRFGFSSNADEKQAEGEKRYTSVLITYDMTVKDYAELYADPTYYRSEQAYLKEVCSINHLALSSGEIQGLMPGNYIIIPYYADAETSALQ